MNYEPLEDQWGKKFKLVLQGIKRTPMDRVRKARRN